MKLRHIPAALLLLTLPALALAKGWVKDPKTGCEIFDDSTAVAATWDGACVGGKASGNGTATYKYEAGHSDVYKGEMEDGKPHGQGVYLWDGGMRYEGQFKDGKQHGQGVLVWPAGSMHYEGAWKNDRRHGLGKQINDDGSLFHEGQWVDDMPAQATAVPALTFGVGDIAYACYENSSKSCRVVILQPGETNTQVEFPRPCAGPGFTLGRDQGEREWVPTEALMRSPNGCPG